MKVLVTGAAGFIGSHIVDRLVKDGHQVICIDDESAPQNNTFYWNNNTKNVKSDIRDKTNRKLYEGVNTVFHLAARSRIQPTVDNPSECFEVNVLGTQEVLEASRQAGVKRVIYSGSSSYYGNLNKIPFKEDMPPGCATPYSLSKWQGEEICNLYSKLYDLSTVSLRYFNVYGDREPKKGQYAPVIGLFKRQIDEGQPMTIVGDGKQRRDFTHIKDIVEANILAMKRGNVGGIINIGTGKNYSINEIADAIGGDRIYLPIRVGETKETLADNKRAREELEWLPTVDVIKYIKNIRG